jgi:hypothetical protein
MDLSLELGRYPGSLQKPGLKPTQLSETDFFLIVAPLDVVSLCRERAVFFFVALLAACHYTERERKEFFFCCWWRPLWRATTLSGRKEFFLFGGTDFSGSLCNQVFFLKKNIEIEHSH